MTSPSPKPRPFTTTESESTPPESNSSESTPQKTTSLESESSGSTSQKKTSLGAVLSRFRGEPILRGFSLLLILSIVQRIVGFGRSVYFCRTLDESALGLWELGYGFLVVASPLVVFSIPGTLGRYAPFFEQQGVLRSFLQRIATLCVGGTFIAVMILAMTPKFWSQLLLGNVTGASQTLIVWMAIALLLTNAMNFAWEMFTALKALRATAMVQFGNSVAFLVAAILLLRRTPTGESAMVAYVLACGVTVFWAIWRTQRLWRTLPIDTGVLTTRDLLRRIGPTALWLWGSAVMLLLFNYIDRLLPVWLMADPSQGVRMAGVCGSASVVPQLLLSITTLFVAAMVPHFAEDWHQKRFRRLRRRIDLFLRWQTVFLCAAAVGMLWCVPWPLRPLFLERYPGAEAIFPWMTVSMIFLAMIQIVQCWFLCAERLGIAVAAFGLGLILKTGLAVVLIPHYGLDGVVTAMVIAHAVTLLLLLGFAWRYGFRPSWGTLGVMTVPAWMGSGPWFATVACAIAGGWATYSAWRKWRMEI